MQFFSLSDLGKTRPNNEDFATTELYNDYAILILADGMGGHSGGEIASDIAVKSAMEYIKSKLEKNLSSKEILSVLREAVKKANEEVYKASENDKELFGMGTTIDICVIKEKDVFIAHVGDSRVYKITKKGEIEKITRDHSLVEYMVETGAITPEEAAHHPQKNIITRALGTNPLVEADTFTTQIDKSDKLLLCTDGLTNMVEEERIADLLSQSKSPDSAAKSLVEEANKKGGTDNITVIVAF